MPQAITRYLFIRLSARRRDHILKIENIVCLCNLNSPINLHELCKLVDLEFEPEQFPGAFFRIGKIVVTLYKSGKFLITGAKSIEEINETFNLVKDTLSAIADTTLCSKPQIVNMVCSSNVMPIKNVQKLYIQMCKMNLDVTYEPETSHLLILKTKNCTYCINPSGRYNIYGCSSMDSILNAEQYLVELLASLQH